MGPNRRVIKGGEGVNAGTNSPAKCEKELSKRPSGSITAFVTCMESPELPGAKYN